MMENDELRRRNEDINVTLHGERANGRYLAREITKHQRLYVLCRKLLIPESQRADEVTPQRREKTSSKEEQCHTLVS